MCLVIGGERVKEHVSNQKEHADEGRWLLLSILGHLALILSLAKHESADAHGEQGSADVLPGRVCLALDCLAHEHHRDDLAGLGKDLGREADVFQSLILTPRAQDV